MAQVASSGLKVADEVEHTGARPPATHFRRKIMPLLSNTDEPLTIDFVGISRASSSFLDELLGRLVKELGIQKFQKEVKIINMSDQLMAMSNVVIQQRMEGFPSRDP